MAAEVIVERSGGLSRDTMETVAVVDRIEGTVINLITDVVHVTGLAAAASAVMFVDGDRGERFPAFVMGRVQFWLFLSTFVVVRFEGVFSFSAGLRLLISIAFFTSCRRDTTPR